jgi:Mg2+/citrate symporter
LLFAPLSIVQAIGSTTTLFVFAIGIALTLMFPNLSREDLSAREIASKGAAAVLVAAGVALVGWR